MALRLGGAVQHGRPGSPRPIGPGEPTSNPMLSPPGQNHRPSRSSTPSQNHPPSQVRPAQPDPTGPARTQRYEASMAFPVAAEDHPKPLYRDDKGSNGWSRPTSRMAPMESDPPTQETMRPIAFAPRRPAPPDDETTTDPSPQPAHQTPHPSPRCDRRLRRRRRADASRSSGQDRAAHRCGRRGRRDRALSSGMSVRVGKQPSDTAKRLTIWAAIWESDAWPERDGSADRCFDAQPQPGEGSRPESRVEGRWRDRARRKRGCSNRSSVLVASRREGQPPPQQEICQGAEQYRQRTHRTPCTRLHGVQLKCGSQRGVRNRSQDPRELRGRRFLDRIRISGQPVSATTRRWRRREGGATQEDRGAQHRPPAHWLRAA